MMYGDVIASYETVFMIIKQSMAMFLLSMIPWYLSPGSVHPLESIILLLFSALRHSLWLDWLVAYVALLFGYVAVLTMFDIGWIVGSFAKFG